MEPIVYHYLTRSFSIALQVRHFSYGHMPGGNYHLRCDVMAYAIQVVAL